MGCTGLHATSNGGHRGLKQIGKEGTTGSGWASGCAPWWKSATDDSLVLNRLPGKGCRPGYSVFYSFTPFTVMILTPPRGGGTLFSRVRNALNRRRRRQKKVLPFFTDPLVDPPRTGVFYSFTKLIWTPSPFSESVVP